LKSKHNKLPPKKNENKLFNYYNSDQDGSVKCQMWNGIEGMDIETFKMRLHEILAILSSFDMERMRYYIQLFFIDISDP